MTSATVKLVSHRARPRTNLNSLNKILNNYEKAVQSVDTILLHFNVCLKLIAKTLVWLRCSSDRGHTVK